MNGTIKHTLTLLAALLLAPMTQIAAEKLPDGVRRVSPSELRIERDYIGEPGLARPVPQGLVDANPPWLHVQVPLPRGKEGGARAAVESPVLLQAVAGPAIEGGRASRAARSAGRSSIRSGRWQRARGTGRMAWLRPSRLTNRSGHKEVFSFVDRRPRLFARHSADGRGGAGGH